MRIIQSSVKESTELPVKLVVSFKQVYDMFAMYSTPEYKDHVYYKSAKKLKEELDKYPELIDGFSDPSLLEKYQEPIELMLEPLFPELLQANEIKAASIPFSFTSFKFTSRFEDILDNAGDDYSLTVRNFEEDTMYLMACSFILNAYYGFNVDLKRPFFFDIPDANSGIMKHYRAAFNGDFLQIEKNDNAPKITKEDYKQLIDNFDNVEIWKEKFPPESYTVKGFGIMNLIDVTTDHSISSIRTSLLKSGDNLLGELQLSLQEFFNIPDLKLGYTVFTNNNKQTPSTIKESESLLFEGKAEKTCNEFFCHVIIDKLFKGKEVIAISDVDQYGVKSNENPFYHKLREQNINSIILIPIEATNKETMAVLEIASPRKYELNTVNQNKLKDIIPAFEAAVNRSSEEFKNAIEATIQEHYTSLHETVKWRFVEAAENYQRDLNSNVEGAKPEEIVFDDVYPLFGQSDIRGSSVARNIAIQEDLVIQLSMAIHILDNACKSEKLPIYHELQFRVNEYLEKVKDGLNAGDEIGIIDFLKREIYPVFKHIKELNNSVSKEVDIYMDRLDPKLNVVYEKRKDYENSVSLLNDKLAQFIDAKQHQAQEMYPHYFERYKTDGVEHDMYIGQSLVNDRPYDNLYLQNLRLWQLQMMYEMENVAHSLKKCMPHQLEIASLVLVHSNPLSIRFRMDEKQFDVDGAYNIRYEIIKKRIDKAHIKGTDERLTVPGKISIVYSQDKNAAEYLKYIKFLQSKNCLGKVEKLELEDLQGVSGLKALRVEVIYQENFNETGTITLKDLMKEIEA